MKHLRSISESVDSGDIFYNHEILKDLLQEYIDNDISYKFQFALQKKRNGDLYAIASDNRVNYCWKEKSGKVHMDVTGSETNEDYVKVYIIYFDDINDKFLTSDKQRTTGRMVFSIPDDRIYNFFKISKDIQGIIESMGHTFALSTTKEDCGDGCKAALMILEGKHS
jgi:hypothetical protein